MNSKKICSSISVLLFLLLIGNVRAGSDNTRVGTRTFNFLKIEVAARPVSMGGAFTGVADDESALYYNPAGVAALEGRRYIFGYQNNVFDMQSGFAGYIHPLGENKKISVYLDYLSYGEFIRTDEFGAEDGTFSGSDLLLGLGYAMSFKNDIQAGATLKLIYEKVDVYSSHGFAFDFGLRKSFNYDRGSIGLMIQNLGVQLSGFTSDSEKDPLPLRFRIGGAIEPRGLPMKLAGDIVLPADNDAYFAIGMEFLAVKPLFLRLGWSGFGSNYKTGMAGDDISGFAAGFGVKHNNMQLSYAISPQAELGTSHRITLTGSIN
jgi:hypothetical protein